MSSGGTPPADPRQKQAGSASTTGNQYFTEAVPCMDLEKAKLAKLTVGMFILAINNTDSEDDLTMAALLEYYKSQQKVGCGFRFLKSPKFLTSAIFSAIITVLAFVI